MMTLQIDNHEIEQIFVNGFNGNKEKFLAFIEKSYQHREILNHFEEERAHLIQTYNKIKDDNMEMFTEDKANQEIDRFLETL